MGKKKNKRGEEKRKKHLLHLKNVLWLSFQKNLVFLPCYDNVRREGFDLPRDTRPWDKSMVLLFTMTHLMCHVKEVPRNAYPTIRVVPDGSFGKGGERKRV